MKKVIVLLLITGICNASIAQYDSCGCKASHYAKLTRVRSGFRLSTPSDEVYLRLMREYRECALRVIMVPNLVKEDEVYTYYYVYFKPSMKPIIQKFIAELDKPEIEDTTGVIIPPSPMVKGKRNFKYYWRRFF